MKTKVIVRTWHKTPTGEECILKTVELPMEVIIRIDYWAIEQQFNLLYRKYIDLPVSGMSRERQEANRTSNELWHGLQEDGYISQDEFDAITFLIKQYEDNPESIDLDLTVRFLSEMDSLTA